MLSTFHRRAMPGAAAVLLLAAAGMAGAAEISAPQIRVAQGVVRGQSRDGLAIFRSIPFAAAPVGPLRFKAPQAPKNWQGVRDAVEDGPSCPQAAGGDPAAKASTDEDCLRLNVFAPAGKASARRPVMVWIHGGGFSEGFAGARQYDPSALVREGGIIVVSIAYRLGTLGLLATASLDAANGQPSGNNAIRDQQAALRWVQKNIGAFGGDAHNVTIFGESAGASSVVALVASPLSQGLFQKAITQSASNDGHAVSRAEMEQSSDEVAEALGCKPGPGQVECLRKLPVEDILKVRKKLSLVQDGQVLPIDPYAAARDGKINRVPMIIGSNQHEGYFFASGAERRLGHPMTQEEAAVQAMADFGLVADEVMKQYPAATHASPAAALGDANSDMRFSCYSHLERGGVSKYAPVFGYEMNEPDPAQQQPRQKISLANTSYHTSDLAYLFDYDTAPLTGDAAALGHKMRSYWIQFARTGSPNGNGRPDWPKFDSTGSVLNLSNSGGVTTDFGQRHNCAPLQRAGLIYWEPK